MSEISATKSFKVDQIVWAKVLGYPWWPGRIYSIDIDKKDQTTIYTVSFIGEDNHAEVKTDKIWDFTTYKENFQKQRNIKNLKKFHTSIELAERMAKDKINPEEQSKNAFNKRLSEIKQTVTKSISLDAEAEKSKKKKKVLSKTKNPSKDKVLMELSLSSDSISDEESENKNKRDSSSESESIKEINIKYTNRKRGRPPHSNSNSLNENINNESEIKTMYNFPNNSKNKDKNTKISQIFNIQKSEKSENCEKSAEKEIKEFTLLHTSDFLNDKGNTSDPVDEKIIHKEEIKASHNNINIQKEEKNSEKTEDFNKLITKEISKVSHSLVSITSLMDSINKSVHDQKNFQLNSVRQCEIFTEILQNYSTLTTLLNRSKDKLKENFRSFKLFFTGEEYNDHSESTDEEFQSLIKYFYTKAEELTAKNNKREYFLPYVEFFKFIKQILAEEFNTDFKEFASEELFFHNVINSNFLSSMNNRMQKDIKKNEKEGARSKVRLELEKILSHSVIFSIKFHKLVSF
jgi:hypothetical protein